MQTTPLETQILLNQVCQGVRPFEDVEALLSNGDCADALWNSVAFMVYQSHPTKADVKEAIVTEGLKPTFTPCVMLLKEQNQFQIQNVTSLPEDEWRKALRLLIAVFRISDGRRKIKCGSDCHHSWHQDLGDDRVLELIRTQGYL